ncbi:MAG: ankyrin repeat domain-containing protein [Planctomycetes bacterium]|nr:ankyrin repeat domain-containing protein [Planctomycetota bacterium]
MLLKFLFWGALVIDLAVLGLMFVLGLAAAGPSKTNPLAVVFAMLLVPGLILAGAVLLFTRTQSPGLRVLATLVVAAPLLFVIAGRLFGEAWVRFGPPSPWGSTPLTRALGQLERDPGQLATIRTLLAERADPNQMGEELPLTMAIRAVRHVGNAPVEMLLDAGADPNALDQFGRPVWFHALTTTTDGALLRLLLERGADARATTRDGHSAVWAAVAVQQWRLATMLVQRGAGRGGTSPMGLSLLATLEEYVRDKPKDDALAGLLAAVRAVR